MTIYARLLHAGRHLARAIAGLPDIGRNLAERRRRERESRRASGGGHVYRLDHRAEQIPTPRAAA